MLKCWEKEISTCISEIALSTLTSALRIQCIHTRLKKVRTTFESIGYNRCVEQQINMRTALILALCVILLLQNSVVDAQRNRRPSARDNIRGGSGGPTAIRFPTEEEDQILIKKFNS
ncbi:hypothetical protein TNIN_495771 [Trichonephila inaurata madagascariensis]|uniref:Uncharacterized protein n=1 Tax=Trichonephila inaurata madagascariensis TaxID=2747483 RepID=A0A8X6XIT1_9ARAC|nr:hypothetical protein TNIN_495771 [Trichonephila inaurata madagascariensis]